MDRVAAADQRGRDDVRDVEVRAHRPGPGPTQNASSAWRTCSEPRSASREDRDRRDAEFVTGAVDAQRDLAAIGDQDFPKHRRYRSIANSGWPYSTGWPSVTKTALMRPAPRERTGFRMPERFDVGQLAVALEVTALGDRRAAGSRTMPTTSLATSRRAAPRASSRCRARRPGRAAAAAPGRGARRNSTSISPSRTRRRANPASVSAPASARARARDYVFGHPASVSTRRRSRPRERR